MRDVSGAEVGDLDSRHLFGSVLVKAVPQAVFLINYTFIERSTKDLSELPNVLTGVTFQTISVGWIDAAQNADSGPINVDPKQGAVVNVLLSARCADPSLNMKLGWFLDSIIRRDSYRG